MATAIITKTTIGTIIHLIEDIKTTIEIIIHPVEIQEKRITKTITPIIKNK